MYDKSFLRPRSSIAGGKRENMVLLCNSHTAFPLASLFDGMQKHSKELTR